MKILRSVRHRKTILGVSSAAALLAVVATYGAASSDDSTHTRDSGPSVAGPKITGQASGGGCRSGYDTQTATLVPPDDSTGDNVAAAAVSLKKTCAGAVFGEFTTEASTPNVGDFIHIDMRATCTATGGLSNPCTVGQQFFASPGHTFMRNGQGTLQTNAVNMVWTGLPRGVYLFQVLPGGNNSANLQFRTYLVEAFNGG